MAVAQAIAQVIWNAPLTYYVLILLLNTQEKVSLPYDSRSIFFGEQVRCIYMYAFFVSFFSQKI